MIRTYALYGIRANHLLGQEAVHPQSRNRGSFPRPPRELITAYSIQSYCTKLEHEDIDSYSPQFLKNLATKITDITELLLVFSETFVARSLDGLSPSFNITRRAGTDGQLTAAS
jgi:hypothetical protein